MQPTTPRTRTGEPPAVAELAASYLESLERRGLSPSTRRNQASGLRRWLRFLLMRRVGTASQIRADDVQTFQVWLSQQRVRCSHRRGQLLAGSTRQNWMSSVRSFCQWLVRTDVLLVDPAHGIPLPRAVLDIPRVLSRAELEDILAAVEAPDEMALRDRALIEVLYSCGLRACEALGLNLADVDLALGEVLVRRAKGGGRRRVPLGEPAALALEDYLARGRSRMPRRHTRPPDPQALFLSRHGTRVIRNSLGQMIRCRAREGGVAGRVTAHTYRHTAAVHLLEGGADVRYVQEFLGHASAETTVRYTRLTLGDLKAALARCHPRERRRRRR